MSTDNGNRTWYSTGIGLLVHYGMGNGSTGCGTDATGTGTTGTGTSTVPRYLSQVGPTNLVLAGLTWIRYQVS